MNSRTWKDTGPKTFSERCERAEKKSMNCSSWQTVAKIIAAEFSAINEELETLRAEFETETDYFDPSRDGWIGKNGRP
jgi:hypothetical protein